jgi:hypothetical protein
VYGERDGTKASLMQRRCKSERSAARRMVQRCSAALLRPRRAVSVQALLRLHAGAPFQFFFKKISR